MDRKMGPDTGDSIVIPRENAVFWMDAQGRWRNQHGPFSHKGIIDHFNRSIQFDAGGFFVSQMRDGFLEKVYFRCEETAIFAIDTEITDAERSDSITLVLNTGRRIDLNPGRLFICRDSLFQEEDDHPVKFSERAMMKLGSLIALEGDDYLIHLDDSVYKLPQMADLPTYQ